MGLLGKLKDRILHKRDEDLYDFRSHVTGEAPTGFEEPREPVPLEPLPRSERPAERFDEFAEPIVPRSRLKDLTVEPLERERFERTEEKVSRDYDIIDRLNIIEAQLQAIRSQTETINERLKNLELRLGTRRI